MTIIMSSVPFKLLYENTVRWVKLTKNFSFADLTALAYEKFPSLTETTPLQFMDADGAVIDEEFLETFLEMNESKFTIKVHVPSDTHQTLFVVSESPVNVSYGSLGLLDNSDSTLSVSDVSETEDDTTPSSSANETAYECVTNEPAKYDPIFTKPLGFPPKQKGSLKKHISEEELKQLLVHQNCQYIFEEYKQNDLLSTETRKKLVRAVSRVIEEKHSEVTPTVLKHYSEALVQLFPTYKAQHSEYPYEAFYNPITHGGFLSWRIKNIKRRQPKRRVINQGDNNKNDEPPAKKIMLTNEIQDAIIFLKNAGPSEEEHVILEKMRITFAYRRQVGQTILQEFPRFLSTPGLIDWDFSLMFPNSVNLTQVLTRLSDKILEIYQLRTKVVSTEIIPSKNENSVTWDRTTRAMLALLAMLPPTARGKKVGVKDSALSVKEKLIVFRKSNLPKEEITSNTRQPLLIAQGTNIGAVHRYNISIDNEYIPCKEGCTSAEAFASLFKSFFVFQVEYDPSLIYFYSFIQLYMAQLPLKKCDKVCNTAKMVELAGQLGLASV